MSKKKKLSRAEASRRNGALSRGPTSPEGKERSSSNAVKHGLTARYFFVSPEEQAEFDAFLEGACDHWSPRNVYQRELVRDLARVEYLHRRAHAIQLALIDHEIDLQAPEISRVFQTVDLVGVLALGFRSLDDQTHAFRTIDDHLARLSRDRIRLTALVEKALGRPTEAAPADWEKEPRIDTNAPQTGPFESKPSDVTDPSDNIETSDQTKPLVEPRPQGSGPQPQQEETLCPA